MNQRTPADPPPVVGQRRSVFSPAVYSRTSEPVDALASDSGVPPRKSFFRGVAVGLAIMIPVWAWLLIRLVR